MTFNITVRFPAPNLLTSPFRSPDISATMFGFDCLVGDMDDRVIHDSIFMRSMDRSIHINRAITKLERGSLKSTHQIDLYAHNGAVTINADLVANESFVTPTLLMTTVYGPIEASINLLTRPMTEFPEGADPPRYKATFHPSNAPLSVTYAVASESHNLTLYASNSHARSTIRLPDSFVGALALRSPQSQHRLPMVHLGQGQGCA